jgi:hypothetical protein
LKEKQPNPVSRITTKFWKKVIMKKRISERNLNGKKRVKRRIPPKFWKNTLFDIFTYLVSSDSSK